MSVPSFNQPFVGDAERELITPRELVWFSEQVTAVDATTGYPSTVVATGVNQKGVTVTWTQTMTYDASARLSTIVHAITGDTSATFTKTETFNYSGTYPKITVT